MKKPKISIIMGSKSDWPTMQLTSEVLNELDIEHDVKVVSAHRTPDLLYSFAESAREKGIEIIIAGAGGSAHLAGMTASKTSIPVLGVPIESKTMKGLDSLLSVNQMPAGIPVGTLAIGNSGAKNAALLAASILSINDPVIAKKLDAFRKNQTNMVLENSDPRK
mgnify:FL=1